MKKIAIIFISVLLFVCLPISACADVVTTTPQEGTAATTAPTGYDDGIVREVDISVPITACFLAVCAFIVYGIIKLKKVKKDGFDI